MSERCRSEDSEGSNNPSRSNPFDSELYMDERHYEQSYSEGNKDEITNSELGIAENHFSREGQSFGLTQAEELELAIDTCKDLIRRCDSKSERRKKLVKKLIELRIQLYELKEGPTESSEPCRVICGHKFANQDLSRSNRYCERCNSIIWVVLQSWFQCRVCGYACHEKCLNLVTRTCAGTKLKDVTSFVLKICPEIGLAAQKYRCAECKARLSFVGGRELEPRLCDYSGLYYCYRCHWNDLVVIPARVVHNWDFVPQKVSRYYKQFLKIMYRKPMLQLDSLNPALCNFIEELRTIREIRKQILLMKCYFLCCQQARKETLLLKLRKRQHFVDSADTFAMQDLVDLQAGTLETELREILAAFAQHIRHGCVACQGNGFICELCSDKQIIFPFDDYVSICRECWAVFHRLCFEKRRKQCPRCERRKQRKLSELADSSNLALIGGDQTDNQPMESGQSSKSTAEIGQSDKSTTEFNQSQTSSADFIQSATSTATSTGAEMDSIGWAHESTDSAKGPAPPPPSPQWEIAVKPLSQLLQNAKEAQGGARKAASVAGWEREKEEGAGGRRHSEGPAASPGDYDEKLNPFAED